MLKWLNKIDLLILLAIMAVMIFAVLMLYGFNNGKFTFLNNKNQKQNLNQEIKEEEIKRTDYTDVARKTLDWIDRQRNEEGWYILERGCDYEKKTCDVVWDNKEGNKDSLIATWARLNFYEQHQDPKDLEIVKKDIDIFYDKYKNDNLKDSLWICKITYEMAQSKYIDQIQKDKLKELCFDTQFPTPKETETIRKNNVPRLEKISKQKEIWKTWEGYDLVMRGISVYFGYTSEMMNKFSWTKDSQYLNQAKEYFGVVEKQLENIQGLEVENKCLVGLSSLDLYQMGDREKKYLDYADNVFEKFIINPDEKERITTPICGLLVKKLYQITRENKYFSSLEFISRILDEYYSDNLTNKITSENGFYKSNTGRIYAWYKNVVENGLITELIRD